MRNITSDKSINLRRERNADLIRRIQAGESTSSFNSFSSWYPPRPIIEKNNEAIQKLYGGKVTKLVTLQMVDGASDDHHSVRPLRLA